MAEDTLSTLLSCFPCDNVLHQHALGPCRRIVERVDKAEVVVDYANDIDTQMCGG